MSIVRESFENEGTESALPEFTCAICLNVPLPNEASVSNRTCQHVFCASCLKEWFKKNERCPTCNRAAESSSFQGVPLLLKETSPLAFRILGRLKVKCTLKDCTWKGDLSEFDSHLTNSDNHRDKTTVISLKDMGNERFAAGRYEEALRLYEKALSNLAHESPRSETASALPVLLSNKAAALLKLNRPAQAADACERAIAAGSTDPKVFVRWSHALTQIGRFEQAYKVLKPENNPQLVSNLSINHAKALQHYRAWEESAKALEKGDYEQAKVLVAELLHDPNCTKFARVVSRAALIEAHIGNVDLALRLSLEAARTSPEDEQAWIARANALVSNGQFDEARQSAKQALRLNPDDEAAKACNRYCKFVERSVQAARQAAEKHDWETARSAFLELVTGTVLPKKSPLRVQLLAERAHASYCAGLFHEALKDASQAIYQQDDCQRAWLTRFYCLRELGRHEEAVKDARELLQRWGANDIQIRNAAEKAEFELRKSKRPDLYGVLSVSQLASEMEIKQAYKQKALVFHPDKLGPSCTEEERKRCEETFKLMGIALDVLGNQEKRELWDKGFDLQGVQEELERRRRRSHHG